MKFRHKLASLTLVSAILSACHSELSQPSTGVIQTIVTGLPAGAPAILTVTGPNGFTATIDAGDDLVGLVPGSYTVSAPDVDVDINIYSPETEDVTIDVEVDRTTSLPIPYMLSSGILNLSLSGVPTGLAAAVTITGPASFARTITTAGMVTGLKAGTYAVRAASIDSAGHVFSPAESLQTVNVEASMTPQPIAVSYGLSTGQARIDINGIPVGAIAAVTVTGPNSFASVLTGTTILQRLTPGTYSVSAQDVVTGGHIFTATGTSFAITPNLVPVQRAVSYVRTTGELRIDVMGLPSGINSVITVSGPDELTRNVSQSDTLVGLPAGTYMVTADSVNANGFVYEPVNVTQTVNMQTGGTVGIEVSYNFNGSTSLDLTVPQAYIVQSIQRTAGDVALVAGGDAYARVFVTANESNSVVPNALLRIYHNGSVVQTFDISANRSDTPTSIAQQSLANSWNVFLPGSLIVVGMAIDVVADPGNIIPELDESNNTYPTGASPQLLDVRPLPPFQIRFVPVLQGASTGRVDTGNGLQFLSDTESMFPMHAVDWDVHAPMTTTAPTLMSGDQNNAWGTVLGEVRALRIAEGASHYYYGVVRVNYTSGVAGLGYVPSSATSSSKVSIGWDYLPSGSEIMAHELGHNFGRNHAPCGGPAGVDPSYPYSNAAIGQFGFDITSVVVKASSLPDIMSYCNNPWVSDYTYEGIFARREAEAANTPPPVTQNATSSLLVWGRIVNDSVVLEPAFELNQAPRVPSQSGPYLLEGIAFDGSTTFAYRFAGAEVADLPGGPERHFAFLIPRNDQAAPLRALQVTGPGVSGERVASVGGAPNVTIGTATIQLDRVGTDRFRIQWDPRTAPMIMVRDATTGAILGFARGGDATLWTTSQDVELIVSDGLRSVAR